MKWIELFINFVRDGLPSPVSLDFLLPVGGQERKDIIAEVDQIIEYHRKLKQAHHERMKKRMLKGKETDADADAAFVSGVMDNLHIGGLMGDVADVTAEHSDEEADEDAEGSSDEYSDDEAAGPNGAPRRPLPPLPTDKDLPAVLQPIRRGAGRGRKDRAPINPPTLKHVPTLVPVFVELVSLPSMPLARSLLTPVDDRSEASSRPLGGTSAPNRLHDLSSDVLGLVTSLASLEWTLAF